MPAQTKTVTLKGKHGAKAVTAAKEGASTPINYGFQRIPGGIANGIAKVKECYLTEYKKDTNQKQADGSSAAGELYLRISAVVVQPKVHHDKDGNPIPTAGMQTSVMVPILSKGLQWGQEVLDLEACIQRAQNELRKIVGESADASDFDSLVALVAQTKPYTKFSTSFSKPQIDPRTGKPKLDPKTGKPYEPMVFENWNGSQGLENWSPEDTAAGAVEEGDVPADDAPAFDEFANDKGGGGGGGKDAPAAEGPGDHELDELVEKATKKDKESQKKLTSLAKDAGMEDEAIENADSWSDLADFIRSAKPSDATEEETGDATEEAAPPKKGDPFFWKKRDKDGKIVRNKQNKVVKMEVEVITVNAKNETVTVKDLDKGDTILGPDKKPLAIPFDQLESE